MKKVFKKFGFTLAEVLITLGIIGVVAAMAIPPLITAADKKITISKLQRAISVINHAQQLSDEETGGISFEDALNLGATTYFNIYWAPFIKVATYCGTYQQCGYTTNTPFKSSNGKRAAGALQLVHNSRVSFITPDGFLYLITNARYNGSDAKENSANIVVDVNGAQSPNKFGHDVFVLTRQTEGKGIMPTGFDKSDEEIIDGCSYTNQNSPVDRGYCAEWIRREGWRIPENYPW